MNNHFHFLILLQNLVAAISAVGSALPRSQRFTPDDVVLSIDSLSRSYPLCQVMNALYSNASVALNSVAGENVDFALATKGVSPTVIIASSRTMADYHDRIMQPHAGPISSFGRWVQTRTLQAGNMPSKNIFSQLARIAPTAELSLDRLRLLCISHRADAESSSRLSSEQLTNLRIYTDARIVYALTGPGIAGAIAQTNVFDYRCLAGPSHFGAPVSSVEITLTDVSESAASDGLPEGQVRLHDRVILDSITIQRLSFPTRSLYLDPPSSMARQHLHHGLESTMITLWNYAPRKRSVFKRPEPTNLLLGRGISLMYSIYLS